MMSALGLNILILLPLLAAIAVWALPDRREELARRIALGVGLLCAAVGFLLWAALPGVGPAGLVGETIGDWISINDQIVDPLTGNVASRTALAISYHVGLDALSMPLVVLTALLVPLAIACSFASIKTRQREYYAWLLALTSGMFGVFAARDLILFYIFFEFTLVPLYFLIGIWGGTERRYAANKFFLFTFVGSVITFAGILYLAIRGAEINGTHTIEFGLQALSALGTAADASGLGGLTLAEQSWLFIAFFCGFAIKVPFFPLHTWLPLAHTEAPTAGSVLLAGVLLKLGTYGFLRFSLPMVPEGAIEWAGVMGWLAVAGIIYGALCSWVQRDIKKLVAFSSVSHLGFCMLGMFSFRPEGLSGSVLYMVNHGINTGALFLIVGMLYDRYHTRDIDKLGGLARPMPIMTSFLLLFVFASVGLPGTNGFISEFTVLFAAYQSERLGPLFGALGATGILLGAIYMLYVAGKLLFGPVKEPEHTPDLHDGLTRDLNRREIAILTPLAVLVILFGFFPRLITDSLDPVLEAQVGKRVEGPLAEYRIRAERGREARPTVKAPAAPLANDLDVEVEVAPAGRGISPSGPADYAGPMSARFGGR